MDPQPSLSSLLRQDIDVWIRCLKDHLGGDDDFHIHWIENRYDAQAVGPDPIELHLPHIRSEADYAVALHEIGHVCGRYQTTRFSLLTREVWAWKYARKVALLWTPAMEKEEQESLDFYRHSLKARRAKQNVETRTARP